MRLRLFSVLSLNVILALFLSVGGKPGTIWDRPAASASLPADHDWRTQAWTSSGIMFIENVGQFDAHARFQVRGGSATLWLAEDALWITVVERPTPPTPFPIRGG